MSGFTRSGHSDHFKLGKSKGSFRPQADTRIEAMSKLQAAHTVMCRLQPSLCLISRVGPNQCDGKYCVVKGVGGSGVNNEVQVVVFGYGK